MVKFLAAWVDMVVLFHIYLLEVSLKPLMIFMKAMKLWKLMVFPWQRSQMMRFSL